MSYINNTKTENGISYIYNGIEWVPIQTVSYYKYLLGSATPTSEEYKTIAGDFNFSSNYGSPDLADTLTLSFNFIDGDANDLTGVHTQVTTNYRRYKIKLQNKLNNSIYLITTISSVGPTEATYTTYTLDMPGPLNGAGSWDVATTEYEIAFIAI